MKKLLPSIFVLGLLTSAVAGAAPPNVNLPAPVVQNAFNTAPQLKVAGAQFKAPPSANPSLLPTVELQKIATTAINTAKKKPASGSAPPTPTALNVTFASQPTGVRFDLIAPANIVMEANIMSAWLKSNMVPTFNPAKNYASVSFGAKAGNVYVVECPITGGPTPMYRVTAGSASPTFSTTPPAYLATADGQVSVDIQGHLQDGEMYFWGLKGCRYATFGYE